MTKPPKKREPERDEAPERDDQHDEETTERRFRETVGRMLNTPPKPQKRKKDDDGA